ncbi:MAG: hypothetical protein IJ916_06370 [Paludibacteraceae bacterium]|nr:hypothetical protein [Paludibacteraceae bacterium]
MVQNNNIPTDNLNIDPMDYDALRAYGLDYIQKIGNKYWTDFNIHDPGVTILEALCFALSDLSYRTNFTIQDLLTPKDNFNPLIKTPSFPAEEILSSNPTTCDEYRKLIMEHVPGVRNVWIEPIEAEKKVSGRLTKKENINGYYNVYVELEEEEYIHFFDKIRQTFASDAHTEYLEYFDDNYKKFFQEILQHTIEDNPDPNEETKKRRHKPSRIYKTCYQNYIKKLLLQHRNLCEDFADVIILEPIYLGFKLDLVLKNNADQNYIIDKLYTEIDKYISPVLQYHTIQDYLDKGTSPENIYQGELPLYGFIDIQELQSLEKKTIIYYSDIYNIILSIDGVAEIKKFEFIETDGIEFLPKKKTKDGEEEYAIKLSDSDKTHVFKLTPFQLSTKEERLKNWIHKSDVQSKITLYSGSLSISTILIPTASKNTRRFLDSPIECSLPRIESTNRNIEQFFPVQKLLPKVYEYKPENSYKNTVLDQAERNQLKGYLAFFNQLLSDYLSKLSTISSYYSIDKEFPKNYIWDANAEQLASSIITDFSKEEKSEITTTEEEQRLKLQNKLLNHLMARFNDNFADYATLMYTFMDDKLPFFEKFYGLSNSIEKKKEMLENYPSLSGYRSQGICYTSGEFEISGVERRILARLGINHPNKRLSPKLLKTNNKTKKKTFLNNSSDDYEKTFGIHILEHILFVPIKGIESKTEIDKPDNDSYSFAVSVIMPGWLEACRNENFRSYVQEIIREEIPAHIHCEFYWINPLVMWDIENEYLEYLEVMSKQTYPHNHTSWIEQQGTAVEKIVNRINKLKASTLDIDASLSTSSWELVTDENEDTDIDYTDKLKL